MNVFVRLFLVLILLFFSFHHVDGQTAVLNPEADLQQLLKRGNAKEIEAEVEVLLEEANDLAAGERLNYLADLTYLFFRERQQQLAGPLLKEIRYLLQQAAPDSTAARAHYMLALDYRLRKKYALAEPHFARTVALFDSLGLITEMYYKALTNLSQSYNMSGEYHQANRLLNKALAIQDSMGISGSDRFRSLNTLNSNYALLGRLAESHQVLDQVSVMIRDQELNNPRDISKGYEAIAGYYAKVLDFNTALYYQQKAYEYYDSIPSRARDPYLLRDLHNGMGYISSYLGREEMALEHYQAALRSYDHLPIDNKYFEIQMNLAVLYENSRELHSSKRLRSALINEARVFYGRDSEHYLNHLRQYLQFLLRQFPEELGQKIVSELETLYGETEIQIPSIASRYHVFLANYYLRAGNLEKAARNSWCIFGGREADWQESGGLSAGVNYDTINPIYGYISYLAPRLEVLAALAQRNPERKILDETLQCADAIIERTETYLNENTTESGKVEITEGYNHFYQLAIHVSWLRYQQERTPESAALFFHYMEKGKAANLLASLRNEKALKLNLPDKVYRYEKELRQGLASLKNNILEEENKQSPNPTILRVYRDELLSRQASLDSLETVLEREYPSYYRLKYDLSTVNPRDLQRSLKRGQTLLNYYLTDTALYIVVVNRKEMHFVKEIIDETFYQQIHLLRSHLMDLQVQDGVQQRKDEFVSVSNALYRQVFGSVEPYIRGEELILSPNNLLSLIPFEILVESRAKEAGMHYRNLPFLFRRYSTSYVQSATLYSQQVSSRRSFRNKALVFAPEYRQVPDMQEILHLKEQIRQQPYAIPGAMEEASYIHDLCGGELLKGAKATESRFKQESSDYDILHMAMHTVINDREPMLSRMLFSEPEDTLENGMLSTIEIYNHPVKSKMVVLSSCNTGAGEVKLGEGIMSMARAFAYAGSPSVIMSVWEVQDEAGVELMNGYYSYLKKGYSKSRAMQKSRLDFLHSSTQVRSLPYFWSSYMIIGDNSPLYYSRWQYGLALSVLLLLVLLLRNKTSSAQSS